MNHNPYKFYLLMAIILCLCIGIALWHYTPVHPLWIYLIALTLITFIFYGYDKYQSMHRKNRVPEAVLHVLALLGGTIGALAGQLIFHHKTRKLKFRLIFMATMLGQIGVFLLIKFKEGPAR